MGSKIKKSIILLAILLISSMSFAQFNSNKAKLNRVAVDSLNLMKDRSLSGGYKFYSANNRLYIKAEPHTREIYTMFLDSLDYEISRLYLKWSSISMGIGSGIIGLGGNIHIGAYAGKKDVGYNNTFIGSNAGENISSGSMNIVIGSENLMNLDNSWKNISIGHGAMYGCLVQTGNNIAIGTGALETVHSADTAGFNIAIGYEAGIQIEKRNVILGTMAGVGAGSDNVVLGNLAASSTRYLGIGPSPNVYDSCVIIGNSAADKWGNLLKSNSLIISNTDTIYPLLFGKFDSTYLDINGTLSIVDTLKIGSNYVGSGRNIYNSSENNLTIDADVNISMGISTGTRVVERLSDSLFTMSDSITTYVSTSSLAVIDHDIVYLPAAKDNVGRIYTICKIHDDLPLLIECADRADYIIGLRGIDLYSSFEFGQYDYIVTDDDPITIIDGSTCPNEVIGCYTFQAIEGNLWIVISRNITVAPT